MAEDTGAIEDTGTVGDTGTVTGIEDDDSPKPASASVRVPRLVQIRAPRHY